MRRIIPLVLVVAASCSNTPSPIDAPFGVAWGVDTSRALGEMLDRGHELASHDTAPYFSTLAFTGGPYLDVRGDPRGPGDRARRGAAYILAFTENHLSSASATMYFADWSGLERARNRIAAEHDHWWGSRSQALERDPQENYEDELRRWLWPVRNRVKASLAYDSIGGPPYSLVVEYVREVEWEQLDTVALDLDSIFGEADDTSTTFHD